MADNIDNTEPPQEKPKPPPLLGKLVRKVPLNLLRFWWAFGIIPCVGLGVAAMLSSKMASTSYSFDATILYSGIPVESAAEKLYIPPDLKTMTQFIKSPLVMQAVCEDMSLPVPPNALASMITVIEPKSMQRIGLKLSWADQEEGKKILDRVIDVYSKSISDTRQEVVSRYLGDLQRRLAANDSRMVKAQTKLREFLERENVRDAEAELVQLQSDIGSLETERSGHLRDVESYKAQQDKVMQRLERQKEAQTLEAEEQKEAAAAEESLADNRRRQDRLNELIEEKRRVEEIRSRLRTKQLEFQRSLKLYEEGYIPKAQFEEIYSIVKGLQAQIQEGPEIRAWQKELELLDQTIVPTDKKKNKGSPIITQILNSLLELELSILNGETLVNSISVELAEKRSKTARLLTLQKESLPLLKEVDAATEERDALNAQLSALQTVHDYGAHEFSVVSPASDAMSYPSSNKKKLFLLFFVGINGALCGPFVLIAVLLSFKQTVEERCLDLQLQKLSPGQSLLELLTESNADRARELYQWNRRVGLSLQQSIRRRGSVISVFPSTHRHRDMELLASMGGILADRDESILLIELCAPRESSDLLYRRELRGQQEEHVSTADALLWMVTMEYGKPPRGLFDYLDGLVDSDVDLVNRVDGSKCHLIHVGRENGHFDRVFSARMNDLIEKCRDEYSMIIMYGPELHRGVDVELQCRHSDGAMVLYDRGESLSQDVSSTLDQMLELGVHFYGCASRPLAFTAPGNPGLIARTITRLTPAATALSSRVKRRPPKIARLFSLALRPFTAPFGLMFRVFKGTLLNSARKRASRLAGLPTSPPETPTENANHEEPVLTATSGEES